MASPVSADTGGHGSVESLVWALSEGLTAAGHDVTVFAAAGSEVAGELVATLPGPYAREGSPGDWHLCEWINLCRAVQESQRFDIVHFHSYLWALPLEPLSRAPMVHTLHIWPYEDDAFLWRSYPKARVTALSHAQWGDFPDLHPVCVVPHGIDPTRFPARTESDGYACYLGSFRPGKGPLEAIAVARAAEMPVVLAGPENGWFTENVAPLIDGEAVRYVGPVTGTARSDLLGGAAALLAPYTSPEPFGLVLIEAMMCGTPVVTTAIGAAPEVVDHGVTGMVVADTNQLPEAVAEAVMLDRRAVRRRAEERFSVARMVDGYLKVYEGIVNPGVR
ncbi:MAG TPA: glycosyltransferase [Acidimicrobiales bacterium]|nr:glycosyltransferase [Acidimicrobiales bacterium]